jgi:hypothetical protein
MGFWQRVFGKSRSTSAPPTETERIRQSLKSLTSGDWSALPMGPHSAGPYVKHSPIEVLAGGTSADAVIALLNVRKEDPNRGLEVVDASTLHFCRSRGGRKVGTWTARVTSDGHPQSGNSYKSWYEKIAVLRQGRDQFLCLTWTTEIYNSAEY